MAPIECFMFPLMCIMFEQSHLPQINLENATYEVWGEPINSTPVWINESRKYILEIKVGYNVSFNQLCGDKEIYRTVPCKCHKWGCALECFECIDDTNTTSSRGEWWINSEVTW